MIIEENTIINNDNAIKPKIKIVINEQKVNML